MKKIKLFLLAVFIIILVSKPITVLAEEDNISDNVNEGDISTQAEIIEWRYKVINGKLNKRQYNYSKEKWIGSWKPV